MVLLDKDDATNRQLAKHQKASAELLEKLSHSSDMAARKAVCLNPNASKEVLIRLAPQFPGDFFLNPAFDWLLLEDPDLLFKLGKGVLKNILKRPDCPLSFIQWAAKLGSEQEQLALAMNPNTPKDIIKALARRKGSLGDAAKGRGEAPDAAQAVPQEDLDGTYLAEVKKALSEVKRDEVVSASKRNMVTAAHRPWLNLDCRLLLDDIPLSLVVIGAMKGREQELAALSNPEIRAWVARFLDGDAKLLESFADDSNLNVRAAVAANPHCPDADFLSLLSDKQAGVRAAAARSVKIAADQAAAMAVDTSPAVREAVCAAWCIPVESLQALAQDRSAAIRKPALARLESISKSAGNPATDTEELSKIAESAKGDTKRLLAANPSTPVIWLQHFVNDGNAALDKALLENPHLPADLANTVYRRVLETLGPLQRIDFLERTGTPRAIRELAGEKSWQSRWPKCQDWLKEAYEFLCAPWKGHGEEALLDIPNGLEAAYAGSMLRSARLLGLAHPRVPPELLIKRSNSVDWAERLAIARNTSLPPNLVTKFQKDPHRLVAAQAQFTEIAKAHIKERQEEVLSQVLPPMDWKPIVEGIQKEMTSKGARPWEWFGTPWWPHLMLHERMGTRGDSLNRRPDDEKGLESLFSSSPFSIDRLSTHPWKPIREWLSGFKDTPLGLLEGLFSTQENLAAQKNWLTRVRLVDDPHLPEKLRAAATELKRGQWGATGKWSQLMDELLRHPDTPEDAMLKISNLVVSEWVAKRYLNDIALPQGVRAVLENVVLLKSVIPFNPNWVNDPKADVRRRVLHHPDVTVAVLEQLLKDKNKEIRLLAELTLVGRSPALSSDDRSARIPELLKRVLGQNSEFKRELCGLVTCPPEVLEALSKEKDVWSFASELASNPSTPEDVLIKLGMKSRKLGNFLGEEEVEDVTLSVCANPSATSKVFQGLLKSKSAKVRALIASAEQTPKEFLLVLLRDSDSLVRAAIARRKDSTPEVQALLAIDPDLNVKLALVKFGQPSMELRILLAKDKEAEVRHAV